MSKTYHLQVPKQLEKHRDLLENTVQPFIKVTGELGKTTLYQSKFGGYPYLPTHAEHPKDTNGKPMVLLAQLNFEEIPHIENMPTKGLLQFFVNGEDDLVGASFDNPTKQENFRIVYHREIIHDESKLVTDFSYLNELDLEYFVIPDEAKLLVEQSYQPVTVGDYRFETLQIDLDEVIDAENEVEMWDIYEEYFGGQGHKIGGYPFFTQSDPREWEETYQEHNILLLQIDTDDDLGIMWGDCGIANFFITKENLLNLDFSNVLYNWDCC
ncbi:YwqG family protein [Bacillus sp. DX4.1]|uniref:YwqG family protein n=1 Tax=Bacillus sp. DX4.1 TaxID=3055867 RepID=UPI0025A2DBE2|nr:YwqG family protein [Bacillus sp. DX4.1]MDM5188824.1 YwqG family protein [Bacillus sp. DX4.1]